MDELYHYGVKGMKWGIRRTPAQLGHKTGSKKKKSTGSDVKSFVKKTGSKAANAIKNHRAASKQKKAAKQEAKRAKKKPISEMSDEELRRRVQRLQLEQQYRQLSPQKISAGRAFINVVGKQVFIPATTNASRQLLNEWLVKEGRKYTGTSGNKNK